MQLVFIQGHDVTYKHMFAHAPVLNKLDKRDIPAVAKRAYQQAQACTSLALAFAGIHHHDGVFAFIIFECHQALYYAATCLGTASAVVSCCAVNAIRSASTASTAKALAGQRPSESPATINSPRARAGFAGTGRRLIFSCASGVKRHSGLTSGGVR